MRRILAVLACLVPVAAFAQGASLPPGLLPGQNLADVPNAAQARFNLGLGALATLSVGANLTSSGGTLSLTSGGVAGALGFTPFSAAGGALAGAITAPGINSTASTGYQQNGATILNVLNGTPYQEGVFIGPRAGQSAPSAINYGTVGIGPDALRFLTRPGSESVAVGPFTCEFLTVAYANTCVGEHAVGFDNSDYLTAFGNDAMRDTVGATGSTAIGAQAIRDGTGPHNTALGLGALQGNAGSISLTGTVTSGDVLSIAFSTTNANVTVLPATASYTVKGGDTMTAVANGLIAAINALGATYTLPDGNTTATESGVALSAFLGASVANPNIIALHFPGGHAAGWAITPAASCVGTCTETMTVGAEMSGTDNIAIGVGAINGAAFTSGVNNIAIGDGALESMSGATNDNIAIGVNSGANITTDKQNLLIGTGAGLNMTGGSIQNVVIGWQAGLNMAAANYNTIVGAGNGNNSCITTGWKNIQVGVGACVPSATAIGGISVGNAIYGTGASQTGSTVSPARIGIGTKAPNAALTIGSAGGGADDGHLGFLGTAPALINCGANPTIDATASDGAGTITEGTAATGCVAPFAVAYSTAPHCVVSSPNGAAFTGYSTSTTALTITNASASGNKYSYVCAQ